MFPWEHDMSALLIPMNYAAQERSVRSRQYLTLKWGPSLKRWAAARRSAWQIEPHYLPLELLARINFLRAGGILWDLLEDKEPEILELDRAVCHLAGCQWFHWEPPPPWYESYMEHSLQELVHRASLELPAVKPARIRHLIARDARSGRLKRTGRGRYVRAPREWKWLEPEERYERDEQDAHWQARYERSRQDRADVLLVHYLIRLPAYRKSKALGISERTYYYHLGQALDDFAGTYDAYIRGMQSAANVQR
jgi:hypothetical protein